MDATWLMVTLSALIGAGVIVIWAVGQFLIFRWVHFEAVHRGVDEAIHWLEGTLNDPLAFAEHYPEANQRFSEHPLLGRSWESLRATLIFTPGEGPVIGCRRPEGYFHVGGLLDGRVDMRFYRAVPGLLISLGLMIAFLGWMVLLHEAGQGLGAEAFRGAKDLVQAEQAWRDLLFGAATQFLPALLGLMAGVWFSWRVRRQVYGLERQVGRLCRLLGERIALITEEQLAYSQLLEAKVQTRRLQQMAVRLDRPVTVTDERGGVAIQVSSQPPIETVLQMPHMAEAGNLLGLEKVMGNFLQQWQVQSGADQEAWRRGMERFASSLDKAAASMDAQVGGMVRGLGDRIGEFQQVCHQSSEELHTINRPFAEVAQLLRETLSQMQRLHETVGHISESFPQATRAMVESQKQVMVVLEEQQERMQAVEGLLTEMRTNTDGFPDLVEEFMKKKVGKAASHRSPPKLDHGWIDSVNVNTP